MSSNYYQIGDEVCLVKNREGVIKFKGQIEGKKGAYYGVEVTVGTGKHSGAYKSVIYFECVKRQGIFVEDKHILYKIDNTEEFEEQFEEEFNPYTNINIDTMNDGITDDFYQSRTPTPISLSHTPIVEMVDTPMTPITPLSPGKPRKKSKKSKKSKHSKKRKKSRAKKQKSQYITQLQYIESDEELDLMETEAAIQLLALSKINLIKKLKNKGIVCLGKKEEMVKKLLTYSPGQKLSFNRVHSLTVNSREYKNEYLTLYECNYYFIHGFVKETVGNNCDRNIFGHKIIICLLQYLNSVIPYFDLCPKQFVNEIRQNGAVLKRNKKNKSKMQYLFGCSKGYEPMSGVYRFSVKINKLGKFTKSEKLRDEIGVISDPYFFGMNDINDDNALWNVDCSSYYISLNEVYGTHKIQSGGSNEDKISFLSMDSEPIRRGDIITVVLDTYKSRMYFEKNGERFCESFNIIKGCAYYPCMSCSSKQNVYEIVFY